MDLSKLKPAKGATHSKKRIARGQGSGHGGTATRGHKGQKSRSGYSKKIGFEGGQMPIQRVVPKFGFTNFNRVEYKAINLKTLQDLADKLNVTTIDFDFMKEHGLAGKNDKVKILGVGELKTKLDVKAHAFSKSAIAAIEKLEGTTEII
ncbi:50S ribosomal protein L15 [Roseimarinus sediminis]|uniref:50S ribosomal protein L15 n=1 Tax=Roseimarinus sediminis TaxID=1610899 RepID=UPI003D21625A